MTTTATSPRREDVGPFDVPTLLRLWWLEWRAVGWPGTLALLAGLAFASMGLGELPPSLAGFQLALLAAPALALALALLPSPGTDRAWDITALSGEREGLRQLRTVLVLTGLTLLVLAALTPLIAQGRALTQLWAWFAPRGAWFAAPALLLLWRTGSPAWAACAVAGMFVFHYCPVPFQINPVVFFEPRWPLHALTALMLLVAFLVPWRWLRVGLGLRLGAGLLAAALVFAPAWLALTPQRVEAAAPAGLPAGLVVLQAPWAALTVNQASDLLKFAGQTGEGLVLLTAHPEQGEPDGTAAAQALSVTRFPVLLRVEGGQVRSLLWPF